MITEPDTDKSIRQEKQSTSGKGSKQKPLSSWTVDEVLHWLKKHIGEGYYIAYNTLFKEHEVTGATLMRCNENTLIRMGIDSSIHRAELMSKIEILRLKSDQVELMSISNSLKKLK